MSEADRTPPRKRLWILGLQISLSCLCLTAYGSGFRISRIQAEDPSGLRAKALRMHRHGRFLADLVWLQPGQLRNCGPLDEHLPHLGVALYLEGNTQVPLWLGIGCNPLQSSNWL